MIVSGSEDKTVKLWDAYSKSLVNTYDDHSHSINKVRFHPDGSCIASASDDAKIKLFDVRS
jgi:centriolar protein POC1